MLFRSLLALLLSTGAACAQLTWGVNGAGGSGTWDGTTQNWFTGTNNVVWNSNAAIFAAPSGTVSISGTVLANQLTFNTAGYVISGGSLSGTISGTLSLITNSDATINAPITTSASVFSSVFLKDGAGTLSVGGQITNFGTYQINNGNLDFTSSSSSLLSNATVALSNTSLAALTLGINFSLGAINGGGSSGGNIQPESASGPITLTFEVSSNGSAGTYAGSLQDNGTSTLSLATANSPNQIFTSANTYSGTTKISSGTFTFSGAGSAQNTSSLSISLGAALILDNSSANNTNRISDSASVTIGGALTLVGNSSAASSETLGSLLLNGSGIASITLTPNAAQPTSLTVSSIGQAGSTILGAVLFHGSNLGAAPAPGTANIYITNAPTLVGGGGAAGSSTISILPNAFGDPLATGNPTTFVTYDVNGVRPLTDAEYANNTFSVAGANVNASGPIAVSSNVTANTLRLQNGAALSGSGTVTMGSGIILGLPGTSSVAVAQLAFGGNPILFQVQGTTTITSPITGTNTTDGFEKLGSGRLILTGANTYSGATHISAGVLNIQNDSALGTATGATTLASGAVLEIQGGVHVGAEALNLAGYGIAGTSFSTTGALRSVSGANSWQGNVTLAVGSIGVDSGSLTLSGNLNATQLTNFLSGMGPISVQGGSLISTSTNPIPFNNLSIALLNGGLGVAPSGTGGNVSVATGGFTFSYAGGSSISVNKANNSSVTLTLNSTVSRVGTGDTMVIMPADGIAALGVSETLRVPTGAVTSNTGGMVSASIVGQDTDLNRSGDFLTNNGTNGLQVATYSASTDINAASGAVFQANSDQTLTASRQVWALKDNGHIIDLGTTSLQINSSGLILNGGTIQNGLLEFATNESLIYTSLAGGTISTQLISPSGLTKFGPGTLTLNGNANLNGTTTVDSGVLDLKSTIQSTINVEPGAVLNGTGRTTLSIGGGTISPGDHVGILTASSVSQNLFDTNHPLRNYTNFAFEFGQTGAPNFGAASASGNDVLRLTSASGAFTSALTASNEVDLYFNVPLGLQAGQTYLGGFFTDFGAAFDSSITSAT